MGMTDVENKGLWMAGLGLGLQYGVIMPYGRAHESEADIVGQYLMAQNLNEPSSIGQQYLMARSGFEPSASIKLWQNMVKLSKSAPAEFMSTHPSNETRIKQLEQHLPVSMKYYQKNNKPQCVKPKTTSVPAA